MIAKSPLTVAHPCDAAGHRLEPAFYALMHNLGVSPDLTSVRMSEVILVRLQLLGNDLVRPFAIDFCSRSTPYNFENKSNQHHRKGRRSR